MWNATDGPEDTLYLYPPENLTKEEYVGYVLERIPDATKLQCVECGFFYRVDLYVSHRCEDVMF